MYVAAILLVAVSLVAYQLSQRAISSVSNPWLPLLVAYVVGAAVCAAGLLLTSRSVVGELRHISGASIVLGFAVVGIELGYLQAHRSGWNPAAVGLAGSVAGTIALALVAAVLLHEPLSAKEVAGLGLCVLGLGLLLVRT